jgi:YVTN family beta-propeller protein
VRLLSALAVAGASLASPAHPATTAYVANALEQSVSVVDVRSGASVATVPVGCDPRDIVAHPDGSRVYVANTCANDSDALPGVVSVIDTATNSVVSNITVPFGPVALAIDARRRRLYAACLVEVPFSDEDSSGVLHVMDLDTGAAVDAVPLFVVPRDLVLSRDGRRAFVSGVAGFRDGEDVLRLSFSGVRNFDVDSLAEGPRYTGAGSRFDIHPSGRTIYVIDSATDELAVVDTATATEVARIPIGTAPQDVLFDKTRRRVFVTSAGESPNALPDVVSVVDARMNTLATTFDGGWAPVGMASLSRRGLLLVTNFYSGSLLVIHARTGALVRTIPVGLGADAVAVVR